MVCRKVAAKKIFLSCHLIPAILRRHHVWNSSSMRTECRYRTQDSHPYSNVDNTTAWKTAIIVSNATRAHTHTHTHTQPINGPLSGTTRVGQYRRNTHPLTPILIIRHLLSTSSIICYDLHCVSKKTRRQTLAHNFRKC